MGVIIRQSFWATLLSYLGALVSYINLIIIFPYCLQPEQIGLVRLITEAGVLFALFCQLGASSAAVRFFPYLKNDQNFSALAFWLLFIPAIGIVILSVLFVFFNDLLLQIFPSSDASIKQYIYHIVAITIFLTYITTTEVFLIIRKDLSFAKFVREVLIKVLTSVVLLLYLFHVLSFRGFITAYVLAHALSLLVALIYIYRKYKPQLHFRTDIFDRKLLKPIFKYALFAIELSVLVGITSRLDLFMITSFLGLEKTGIFSLAFFIALVIEMPYRSIAQISAPFVVEFVKQGEWKKLDILYKKSAINQIIIAGFLYILLFVNINNLFAVMPNGHIYEAGKYVILIIGLSKVFDSATGINLVIFNNIRIYHSLVYIVLFQVLVVFLFNLWLIPAFGMEGAALATGISIIVYHTLLTWLIKKQANLQPFTIQTLKICLIIITLLAVNYIIPIFENIYIDALIRSSFVSIVFLVSVLKLNISPDVNAIAKKAVPVLKNWIK